MTNDQLRGRFATDFKIYPEGIPKLEIGIWKLVIPVLRTGGTALHLDKDLAVSPRLFYPYGRIKPATLGLGSLLACALRHLCSHLYVAIDRLASAVLLRNNIGVSVRTFLCYPPKPRKTG